MSFEAVPCRFQSKTGPNGQTEYVGILIRPVGETGPIQSPGPTGPQNGGRAPNAPFRVIPASGIPVSGDNAPKRLVPTNIGVRLAASSGDNAAINGNWQPTPRVVNTAFSSPPQSMLASPCLQQPRSMSVCSSSPMTASSPMSPPQQFAQHSGNRPKDSNPPRNWQPADSSTTPDSGIQSVPGSPPSHHRESPPTIEACSSVCEDRPDEEDFADMPRLIPIDQEEEFYEPEPSSTREEHSTTGSECETTAPQALSITPLMDNARAAEQLIQLDPAKAYDIAKEIHKQMGLATPEKGRKRKLPKKEPSSKKNRPASSASDEYKKSEEEVKEGTPPLKITSSPENADSPSTSAQFGAGDSRKLYRQAVKKMMEKKLVEAIDRTMLGVQNLHIGERERHERRKTKTKPGLFSIDWDALRKRRRHHEEKVLLWKKNAWAAYKVKNEPKEEIDDSPKGKRFERKRKLTDNTVKEEPLPSPSRQGKGRTPSKRRNTLDSTGGFESFERRPDLDYVEIPRTVCEKDLPGWRVPTVRCGCTKGACNSDAECISRALFVQCQSNCQAHMCINKKFWKEDAVRLLQASGPKSKKALRTKGARRAGDFLGEYAGEVVNFAEGERRWKEYQESDVIPRILSLSPTLFVDATKKGNVSRYVRHSCRPNSRIEVWSINGTLRAGLFPLFDLASSTEVTINMNGLLPVGRPCTACSGDSQDKCCKWIKRSRNAVLSSAEALNPEEEKLVKEANVFLRRNRRKIVKHANKRYVPRNSSVPSTTKGCLQKVFDGFQLRIRRVDGSLPYKSLRPFSTLSRAVASGDVNYFHSAVENLLEKLDDDDLDRVNSALNSQYLGIGDGKDKKHHHLRNREVDLSYLDSLSPVGTYNPDSAWPKGPASKRADAVRCECGSLEEDGKMLQCDECNYWLHTDCIGNIEENVKHYQCRLCSGAIADGIPSTDVKLVSQPEVRLEGCTYFKALTNSREIQVRQYETVYVEKIETDDHKKVLKKLSELSEKGKKKKVGEEQRKTSQLGSVGAPVKLNPPGLRKETRIFRVERLFLAPGGYRFVFGFYYARPHETICDPQKMFHKNEVFATPFYDTLPLDSVVGRCVVLDPEVFIKGRPTVPKFKEEDVLVCDYQIDKQQRSFGKIPVQNRFPMNTQPYVFAKFDSPRPLVRDFTPFLVGDRSSSRSAGRLSRTESSRIEAQARQQSTARLEAVISRLPFVDGAVKFGRKRKKSLLP